MNAFAPQNIAAYLPYRALHNPNLLAVAVPIRSNARGESDYDELSYAELNALSDSYARGLQAHGISKGMRCVLMVTPSIEFFALTFALFKIGAVLVCIDPGMGLKNIKACLGEAEPSAFIGISKAFIAKRLFSWPSCKINISVCTNKLQRIVSACCGITSLQQILATGQSQAAIPDPIDDAQDPAAILFTSGSTGIPKGVLYHHAQFLAQVKALDALYQIEVGECDLCTFPLFALFAPAIGMTSIIPAMNFTKPGSVNPLNIITPIQRYQVSNMFGSPALLKQVARYGQAQQIRLPSLKRVISAGAPARPQTLAAFTSMLKPEAEIFTPYGATESLPVSSIGSKEILAQHVRATENGLGVCVGIPQAAIEVAIIPISDEPILHWSHNLCLPAGQIGEIVVKGSVVTTAYFHRPLSTHLAKIPDGAQLRHRMGDLGYMDANGKLWFCGRKSHRVIVATDAGDKTYLSIPCEGIFNTHPQIERTALISYQTDKNDAIEAAICIELIPNAQIKQQDVIDALRQRAQQHPQTAGISRFFFHPQFPVDIRHNAKINREALSLWASTQSMSDS